MSSVRHVCAVCDHFRTVLVGRCMLRFISSFPLLRLPPSSHSSL